MGYRFRLKNELGALSYIDLSIGASYNDVKFDPSLNTVFYEKHSVRPGQYNDAVAYIDKENTASYSITTKLLVPVFYLSPVFNIKVGASYEADFNKIDYKVVVEETLTDLQDNKEYNTYENPFSYNKTNNNIAGVIALSATFGSSLDFVVEGDFSNYFASGLGIVFRF